MELSKGFASCERHRRQKKRERKLYVKGKWVQMCPAPVSKRKRW